VWIEDDDANVSIARVSDTTEGGTPGTFIVSRLYPDSQDLPVVISVNSGVSPANINFSVTPTVIIPAGQTSAIGYVTAARDNLVEGDGIVVVQPSTSSTYRVVSGPASITIHDDPAVVSISAPSQHASEVGPTQVTVTLTRSGGDLTQSLPVSLNIGGSATDGTDFSWLPSNVTFGANETTKTLTVTPTLDDLIEGDETAVFTITDTSTYKAASGAAAATVVINDDPTTAPPIITVEAIVPTASEHGEQGKYRFTRSWGAGQPLAVQYQMSGTASNGADYQTLNGTVTFPANSSVVDLALRAIFDSNTEDPETAVLTLAGPASGGSPYTLGNDATATVTIEDEVNLPPEFDDGTPEDAGEEDEYHFEINADSTQGGTVGVVIAIDPNVQDSVTYEIVSGNDSGAFALDPFSGTLVLTVPLEQVALDGYTLHVKATDIGGLTDEATVVIDVIASDGGVVFLNMDELYPDLDWPYPVGAAASRFELTGEDLQALLAARNAWLNGALSNVTVPASQNSYYDLLDRVVAAENRKNGVLVAKADLNAALASSATSKEEFLADLQSLVLAVDVYTHDLTLMLKVEANFWSNEMWVSSADRALMDRAAALPLKIDGADVTLLPGQYDSMRGGFRQISDAINAHIQWLDNVEATSVGVAAGIVVSAVTLGAGTALRTHRRITSRFGDHSRWTQGAV
jgi:hypothetical protein